MQLAAFPPSELIDFFIVRNRGFLKQMDDHNRAHTPFYLKDYKCLADKNQDERRRAATRILSTFFEG
jgi:hypothetical protein